MRAPTTAGHPFVACALAVLAACGPNQTHPERQPYVAPSQAPLPCEPNLDGRITPDELSAAVGIPVNLLVSPAGETRTVDVVGTVDDTGARRWDWSVDHADDQVATVSAGAPDAYWFSTAFPKAQFVAPMDAGGTLLAVYMKDTEALWLLGLASVKDAPASEKTLLVYENPVGLYRFPLQPGLEWVTVGKISNGTIRGLPYAGQDTYSVKVDAAGRLELPSFVFTQVLRARTHVTVSPAIGTPTSRRQVSFLFECFGEVARATSVPEESEDDFTRAAELRRLGF